ncbi:MAG: hypothetical protein AB7Q01_16455 [Gammaproteobacteria bacterium]
MSRAAHPFAGSRNGAPRPGLTSGRHPNSGTFPPGQSDLTFDRPVVGRFYTPGGGDVGECRAICDSHVVILWCHRRTKRRVIYTREEFARDFEEARIERYEQREIFDFEGEA